MAIESVRTRFLEIIIHGSYGKPGGSSLVRGWGTKGPRAHGVWPQILKKDHRNELSISNN